MSALPMFRRLLPLVLLLAGFLAAAPTAFAQAEATQARQAISEGRYGEAVSLLSAAIERNASDPELLVLRGQAYEARRQFAEAARDYERALALRANHAEARAGLERVQRSQRAATGTALEAYRRQVEAAPNNLGYRLQYAEALREAGQLAEAATQYEAYLGRTQGAPDVVTRYLTVLANLGRHDRGAAEAQRYLNLYPSSDDLWMRLGYFRLWQGQYGGAEEAFNRSLAINARNQQAATGLEQARNRIAQAPRPQPQAPSPSAEIDRLRAQLARNPNQPDVRFRLIDELVRRRRAVEAFGELQHLEATHGTTGEWRSRLRTVDQALAADAPVYQIDRLRYRLLLDENDLDTRHALVDAYAEAGRFAEAIATLQGSTRTFGATDARYQQRMRRLQEQRLAHARASYQRLTGRLTTNPRDVEAARELASVLPTLYDLGDLQQQNLEDAYRLYEYLLQASPDDRETRYHYAELLVRTRRADSALEQAQRLLQQDPSARNYALYTYAALLQDPIPAQAEQTVERGLSAHPDDPAVLLAAVTFHAGRPGPSTADLDRAERFLTRAEAAGADARDLGERRAAIQRGRDYQLLVEARRFAEAGRYREAVRAIEQYAQTSGDALPVETRLELAELYFRVNDRDRAMSLLREAERDVRTPEARYTVARLYNEAGMHREAYAQVEQVLHQRPTDAYAHALRGDALRAMGRRDEARASYDQALAVATDARQRAYVDERLDVLARGTGFGTGVGVLLAPRFDFIYAGGDGIDYTRFSPGVGVQLALPSDLAAVVTAGAQLHRISGTDLVDPAIAQPVESFGAIEGTVGLLLDLTPADPTLAFTANYTNRLTAEVGVFHTGSFINAVTNQADSNTQLQYQARYWHQTPGQFRGSAGIRQAAGARELWTAIGPSVDLTLFQADVEASAAPLDSLVKLAGRVYFNRVTNEQVFIDPNVGVVGFTGARAANHGIGVDLKVGVRVWNNLYVGGLFTRLRYDENSRLYFSPSDTPYEVYEAFAEYETGGRGQTPYFRVLGALGTVAFSDGFLTRRLEADVIYPIHPGLGFGGNLRLGQSSRAFTDTGDFSSYTVFVLSAALYIGL